LWIYAIGHAVINIIIIYYYSSFERYKLHLSLHIVMNVIIIYYYSSFEALMMVYDGVGDGACYCYPVVPDMPDRCLR